MSTQTSYIQNTSWKQFIRDLGEYLESEFDNPIKNILDMPDDRYNIMPDFFIQVIDNAMENKEDAQEIMNDFLKTCIYHPRYVMEIYETVEKVIRHLIEKGACVSPDIVLKPDAHYGATCLEDASQMGSLLETASFQDEGHTFQIRGFIWRNFLQDTYPISYNAVFWEDILENEMKAYNIDYNDVKIDEEKFLSAIKYEATPF